MSLIFLSSGLFLGWSLGANDTGNIWGTAVYSRMVKFKTAAILCSIFVILGAVISGAGASQTLGKLGAVNAIAGAFTVALGAALAVYIMVRNRLPVSTSQTIVGAIVGWNLFSGMPTDYNSLTKIVATWVICPILAAVFAAVFYYIFRFILKRFAIHLLKLDFITRLGLILIGIFGSYSLGANNIANVVGVFVPVNPFPNIDFFGINISSTQLLFFMGGLAIAIGVFTYSHKVISTIGGGIFKLSPETSLIVVLAESLVLFLFASKGLERFLISHHLPAIPLVPVSSTQAVVGAITGIGLVKSKGKYIQYRTLGKIMTGWVIAPVFACFITFFSLFFMQNVFMQKVYIKKNTSVSVMLNHNGSLPHKF